MLPEIFTSKGVVSSRIDSHRLILGARVQMQLYPRMIHSLVTDEIYIDYIIIIFCHADIEFAKLARALLLDAGQVQS